MALGTALYAVVRRWGYWGRPFQLGVSVLGVGVMLTFVELLLRTRIALFRDRLELTYPGVVGRTRVLLLTEISAISLGPEHDPALRIVLTSGRTITVGPWSSWLDARRLEVLASIVQRIQAVKGGEQVRAAARQAHVDPCLR